MKRTITISLLLTTFLFTDTIRAQVCFGPRTSYTTSMDPSAACLADFNSDGKPDIAVANKNSGASTVAVMLGNGSGGFGPGAEFPVGVLPRSVCAADFNGDGKPDLATTNTGPGDVSVLLGNGSGSFTSATGFTTGIFNSASTIASGDFNGDAKADLVISSGVSFVLLALGNGDGTFLTPTQVTVGNLSHALVTADLNGDLKADLAVTTFSGSSQVSVLLNNGSGGFAAPVSFSVGNSPASLIAADFNGDGKPDLATANTGDNVTGNCSVLLGNGSGGFASAINTGVGASTVPRSLASADFNSDGKMDVALACVSNNSAPGLVFLGGNGTGNFGAPVSFPVDSFPNTVMAADLNADGKVDLVASAAKTNLDSGKISVLLNCTITGIKETEPVARQWQLYPNPGSNIFYLKTALPVSSIRVSNLLGEVISTTPVTSGKAEINLAEQARGTYFYSLEGEGKVHGTGSFILK